jgi:putative endonuclease
MIMMDKSIKQFNRSEGNRGEEYAVRYLRLNGWHIIQAPYRSRVGEIDIIATDGDTLVFVEVKYRQSGEFGNPVLAVNKDKQRRIIKTARYYLAHAHPPEFTWCRFDVMGLTPAKNKPHYQVKHIFDAFQLSPDDMAFSY